MVNTISKFVGSDHTNWDEKFDEIVYSYNSAVQESTKVSPFEAMFGRIACLPIDFNASLKYNGDEKLKQFCSSKDPDKDVKDAMQKKTAKMIKTNIEKAQRKQKDYYDQQHSTEICFRKGSMHSIEEGFFAQKATGR